MGMKSSMPEDAKMAMEHVVSGFKPEVNCTWTCAEGEVLCSDGSCMPTHDEHGCHNHCIVECSEDEQLCLGQAGHDHHEGHEHDRDFHDHGDHDHEDHEGHDHDRHEHDHDHDEHEHDHDHDGHNHTGHYHQIGQDFCIPAFVENTTCPNS